MSEVGRAITISVIGGVIGRLIASVLYEALKAVTAGPRGTSSSRFPGRRF